MVRRSKRVAQRLRRRRRSGSNASTVTSLPPLRDNSADSQETEGGESPAQSPRGRSPSDYTQRTNGVWGRLPTTLRPVQPPRGATPSVEGQRRAHTGRPEETSQGEVSRLHSPQEVGHQVTIPSGRMVCGDDCLPLYDPYNPQGVRHQVSRVGGGLIRVV